MDEIQGIFLNSFFLTYILPIGSFIFVLIIGFLKVRSQLVQIYKSLNFVEEFRAKFIDYCNSCGNYSEAYTWITLNSPKMQREIGVYGVYQSFKPPASDYMVSNYQIIMNMIPELRRFIDMDNESMGSLFASTIDGYIKAIDEALLRYLGVLNEKEEAAKKCLVNPLIWLRSGVEEILALPLIFFAWFGLIAFTTVRSLQDNYIFRVLSFITTMIGLIAAIMTIIMGWNDFILLFENVLNERQE